MGRGEAESGAGDFQDKVNLFNGAVSAEAQDIAEGKPPISLVSKREIADVSEREIADALNPANAGKAEEPDPAAGRVANPAVIRELAQAIRDKLSLDTDLATDTAALDKKVNDELKAAVTKAHNDYNTSGGYGADDPVDSVSDNLRVKLAEERSQKEAALDAAISFKVIATDGKGNYEVELQDKDAGNRASSAIVTLHRDAAGNIEVGDMAGVIAEGKEGKKMSEYISSHSSKLLDATKDYDKRAKGPAVGGPASDKGPAAPPVVDERMHDDAMQRIEDARRTVLWKHNMKEPTREEMSYCQMLWMTSCLRRRWFVPPHRQTVPRR